MKEMQVGVFHGKRMNRGRSPIEFNRFKYLPKIGVTTDYFEGYFVALWVSQFKLNSIIGFRLFMASLISSSTLGQTVAGRLRNAILSGFYKPGSRLTELGLADDMQTSRTPVIAALKALTEQGLVRYASNRGYWVREFSIEEILEAYDIRATLEGMACRLAAEHGVSEEARGLLEDSVRTGDRVLSGSRLVDDDHETYRQMNVAFHNTILHASKNHQLEEFVRRAHEIPLASDRIVIWTSLEIVRRSHDAHVRVLEAIVRGQGTRAEMLMREHIYEAGQVLKTYWPQILAKAKNHELTETTLSMEGRHDL